MTEWDHVSTPELAQALRQRARHRQEQAERDRTQNDPALAEGIELAESEAAFLDACGDRLDSLVAQARRAVLVR